jgi:hypothetical protein
LAAATNCKKLTEDMLMAVRHFADENKPIVADFHFWMGTAAGM